MKHPSLLTSCVVLTILAGSVASAAPCATGTTTDATGQKNAGNTTSSVDGTSTAKVSPGGKSESPGTVGAMNDVGSNSKPGTNEAKPAVGQVVKPGDDNC